MRRADPPSKGHTIMLEYDDNDDLEMGRPSAQQRNASATFSIGSLFSDEQHDSCASAAG
jgi:hypothetical protein